MNFLWQAIRQVTFLLDQITYGLIPTAYEVIFYLSNLNLFGNGIILALINRIYLLLGIFMLFKVSFSILQFLADPNAYSERGKGLGKLVTNSLISITLLVMVPFVFEKAYQLQGDIILSNVIPTVILGQNYTNYSETGIDTQTAQQNLQSITSMGKDVQFALFSAFYTINTTKDDPSAIEACNPTENYPTSNVIGSKDMILQDENGASCFEEFTNGARPEMDSYGATLTDFFKYTDDACANGVCDERSFASFGKLLPWVKGGGFSNFTINYFPIVSAIVGGYMLLLLVTFAIDIATRVFKLLFLQIVAPIAIISYIDPKESASQGKFHSWLVECGKTYVSLFLRLAVIYLAIFLVQVLTSTIFAPVRNLMTASTGGGVENIYYYNGLAPTGTLNMFVYVFLILGIFTFVKKVPQMIESIFGIKMSGELQLNPFKAFKENEGIQFGVLPTAAAVGGLAANTISGIAEGRGIVGTLRSAAGGFFGAGSRTFMGAAHGERGFANMRKSFGSAMFAKQQRADLNRQGSTWHGRLGADVARHLGIMNAGQQQQLDYDRDEKALQAERKAATRDFEQYQKAASAIKAMVDSDAGVKAATTVRNNAQTALARAQATGDANQINAAKNALEKAKYDLSRSKNAAYNKVSQDSAAQRYFDTINDLRNSNSDIAALKNITKVDGYNRMVFDDSSIDQANNILGSLNFEYDRQQAELEARKQSAEWIANELDNSSRRVNTPQPEGWTPHGEISGSYGPNAQNPGSWGPPPGPRP